MSTDKISRLIKIAGEQDFFVRQQRDGIDGGIGQIPRVQRSVDRAIGIQANQIGIGRAV